MNNLLFFYGMFGIVLLTLIVVYQVAARREKGYVGFEDSNIWMYGSINYFMILINVAVPSFRVIQNYYLFFVLSLVLAFGMMNKYIRKQGILPKKFHWVVVVFLTVWVIIAGTKGVAFVTIITPIVFIQGIIYFIMGLTFLLDEEYDLSVRNMTGILFIFYALIKIIYLSNRTFDEVFINSVFISDFILYAVIGFVLTMFDSNKQEIQIGSSGRVIMDSIDKSPLGIIVLNHRGDIVNTNDTVGEKLRQSEFSELSHEFLNISDLTRMPFEEEWEKILEVVTNHKSYSVEADVTIQDEIKTYEFLFLPSAIYDETDDPYGLNLNVVCLVLNNTRQYSVIKSVSHIEEDDYNMPNRYQLMELFEEGIHQKLMKRFSVVLIKIVNYDGIINIVNAHEIATIDQMVKKKLEKLDFVYCIGKVSQDTFEIITKDVFDASEVVEYLNIVKDILNHQSFYDTKMNVYSLDYRIGVAMAPEDGFTQRELLRHASIAITKATREERGYIQFFNDHIKHELAKELQLETKLRDSIQGNELFLEFQPQFSVDGKEIRGFEALVRWRMSDDRVKSPSEFIPLAESMGLMDELGDWVLEQACMEATIWHQKYNRDWMLSVNVSVLQIEQEGFAASVLHTLDKYDYPYHLLEIELTETKMTKSSDRVFLELKALRDKGVKVAIDDFGTGYASLEYLRWVPFDVLKIDKGFIDGIAEENMDLVIVTSIIELVSKMDCITIAEGVERIEQLKLLKETDLNYIQGFIYGRPMTIEAIHDLLEENE